MELFIGGFAQGKTEYVKSLYPDRRVIDENDPVFSCCPDKKDMITASLGGEKLIINHFHLIIRRMLENKFSPDDIRELIVNDTLSGDAVIISDEIGSGLVPMDRFEREYRELVGRCLTEIAKRSESVVRIICQIPMKLK